MAEVAGGEFCTSSCSDCVMGCLDIVSAAVLYVLYTVLIVDNDSL